MKSSAIIGLVVSIPLLVSNVGAEEPPPPRTTNNSVPIEEHSDVDSRGLMPSGPAPLLSGPAPTNFMVSSTARSVTLKWPIVPRAIGYVVSRLLTGAGGAGAQFKVLTPSPIQRTESCGIPGNSGLCASFTDRSLTPGTTYQWVVAAVYADNRRGISQPVKFSTVALFPPPPSATVSWQTLWSYEWNRGNRLYKIAAARSVLHLPSCQGDLALRQLVENYITARQAQKYGDALRLLGQFQDRLSCLTKEGVRGLEFAMSSFLHHSLTRLPPPQGQIAVDGMFNLGMLVFDSIQYTGRSWWLPTVYYHNDAVARIVGSSPHQAFGLWLYDLAQGKLTQNLSAPQFVYAMKTFANFGNGHCSLMQIQQGGFRCKTARSLAAEPVGSSVGSSKGQDSGGALGIPQSTTAGQVSCMVEASLATGARGMLSCMDRSMQGIVRNDVKTPKELLSPSPDVSLQKLCSLRDEGDDPSVEGSPDSYETYERVKAVNEGLDFVKELGSAVIDTVLEPVIDAYDTFVDTFTMRDEYAPGGAFNGGGVLPAVGVRGRPSPDDPGGNCSNYLQRVKALFNCALGSDQIATGTTGTSNVQMKVYPGVNPGVIDDFSPKPLVGSAPLSCLAQGGDMVRTGLTDMKCALARCASPDEPCPCNKTSGGAGAAPVLGGPGYNPACLYGMTSDGTCLNVPLGGGVSPIPVPGGVTGPSGPLPPGPGPR